MGNPSPPNGHDDHHDGDAPTTPLGGGTAPLSPRDRFRQQVAQGSRRGRLPVWQGRPARQTSGGRGSPRLVGPTFRGQQPGEHPIFVRRQHPLFLIIPAGPAVLALIPVIVLGALHVTNVRLAGLFFILEVVLGIIFAIFLLKWLIIDLPNWFFNIYVLTDRRLMDSEGFFTPKRKEANLDRIQQVQVDQTNILEFLFNIGNVQIVTAGSQGDLTFDHVAHPSEVADQVREAEQAYRRGSRPAAAPIEAKNPAVKKVLDELTKPVVVASPHGLPRRTFGGFLHRPAQVRIMDNEVILDYIYRHWFVLIRREFWPALLGLISLAAAGVIAAFLHTALWVVALVGLLAAVIWGALVYLNYADDVFILTSDRIIDIDRLLFFFFQGRKQAEYSKVQDVRVNVATILARILNYGDIIVETAGRLPNIEMSDIPDPFLVQDLIFSRINAVKERDAAAAANRQRMEYRRMLAATMNELLVEVPDLRQLSLPDAGQRLQGLGLRLTIDSERRMRGVPPGVVVAQLPSASTTVLRDSEVRVVISGRA